MTLNGVLAVILRHLAEFGCFRGHYVNVLPRKSVWNSGILPTQQKFNLCSVVQPSQQQLSSCFAYPMAHFHSRIAASQPLTSAIWCLTTMT